MSAPGPTDEPQSLYELLGVSRACSTLELLAAAEVADSWWQLVLRRMCAEALADPLWRETYDCGGNASCGRAPGELLLSPSWEVTLYGSRRDTPHAAAALLRAAAGRYGVALRDVCDVELAAAVIAAEVWMAVTGVRSVSMAASCGTGPAVSWAQIVTTAARGQEPDGLLPTSAVTFPAGDLPVPPSPVAVACAMNVAGWAASHLKPAETVRALMAAESLLSVGGPRLAIGARVLAAQRGLYALTAHR